MVGRGALEGAKMTGRGATRVGNAIGEEISVNRFSSSLEVDRKVNSTVDVNLNESDSSSKTNLTRKVGLHNSGT